jgi:septal ring factor EnvC (AmiA/AmiB activator)
MIICSYSTKCHELVCAQYTFRAEQEKLKKENTTLDSDREYLKRKKHELDKERAHVKRLYVDKMKQMQQLRQDKDSLQQQYHGMAKWAAVLETKNKSMCRRRMLL